MSGQMLLAAPLDYETVKSYELVIRAQDQGIPQQSAVVNVTLNVFDINDNPPEFDNQLYAADIPEDITVMSTILQVHAKDKDSGANARITYEIADSQRVPQFEINRKSGEIYVKSALDREKQFEYSFLVVAKDYGNVSDQNDITGVIVFFFC